MTIMLQCWCRRRQEPSTLVPHRKPCSRKGSLIIAVERPPSSLTPEFRKTLDDLTPRQHAFMRLVAQGYQTKEIARQLSVSADRINKVVSVICQRLKVNSRREAGRLYAEWEREAAQSTPSHSLASQSVGLSQTMSDPPDAAVINGSSASGQQAGKFAEGQASYSLLSDLPDLLDLMPLRRSGRLFNDLSKRSTLIVIARLTLGALIAVGSAVSLLSSLATFVRGEPAP